MNFKQLKVALWPLKLSECLVFKRNLAPARKIRILQLKVPVWPIKLTQCLVFKVNLASARKKWNFTQLKVALLPLKLTFTWPGFSSLTFTQPRLFP